jgi:hypothetical protein
MEDVKEVEENRVELGLVAQPLLAVRFSPLPRIHAPLKIAKPAQPRVAVLLKLSGRIVRRGFSHDIQTTSIGAFRQ